MWKNTFAAFTALGLVLGSNTAMAGDFELGINGSKEEIKIEAKLNDEPFQGGASILVPKDKYPQFGLSFGFVDGRRWSISGEGSYDAETDDFKVGIKLKIQW